IVGTDPSGAPLDFAKIYKIPDGQTLSGSDITEYASGRLLFSIGSPLPSAIPTFTFNSAPGSGWETRWDKVEMSLIPGRTSQANPSPPDFLGWGLRVETHKAGPQTGPIGWTRSITPLFQAIAGISTKDPGAVVTGENGVDVPGVGKVLRVVSPSTVPQDA